MKTVLITGASGIIGAALTDLLLQKGYNVIHLNRKITQNVKVKTFFWDVENDKIDIDAIEQADYIIHLAGEGIAKKRWTKERMAAILSSRVNSAKLLTKAIKQTGKSPKAFISASAVGYYGAVTTQQIAVETDASATDFLGQTCKAWEQSIDEIDGLGARVVKLRIGVVLSSKGGALSKLVVPIKYFAGAALGTGKQFVPWIHIQDLCNMFVYAIENNEIRGVYNAVAPEHISNLDFTKAIAKIIHRPLLLPNIPSAIMKLILGEMSCVVLEGTRVSNEKISNAGFKYAYTTIEGALRQIL